MTKPKLIRVTTVPISLDKLLEGQLKYMSDYYDITAISTDGNGYLKKVAEREGVAHHPIELTRAITPIQDLKALYQLTTYLRKEKPLIVHSHTPKAGTIGMLAAKLAGVKHRFHTVAGLPLLEATGNKRKLLDFVEKITYSAATKVLPNSYGLKEIILNEKYTNHQKLKVIGKGSSNGIDTNYFSPALFFENDKKEIREKWNIQKDDFVYIFVGRLVKDKGIQELVQAFTNIATENSKLLLVGTFEHELDPLDSKTLSTIENNPKIIVTGWQTDVRPFFAIANVLTFASYREGFPNVVMQAGAMGLPSIVSDINGCNEIISNNQNGIIVEVKATQPLADAMLLLQKDLELFKKLQSNARKKIVDNYSRDFVWNELRNFYSSEIKS